MPHAPNTSRRNSQIVACQFEKLESKNLMAADVILDGGQLNFSGQAESDIFVSAVDGNTIQVSEGEIDHGQFSDVTDINFMLDLVAGAQNDDSIVVDLGAVSTVDSVFATLGLGNNIFEIRGQQAINSMTFVGHDSADTVGVSIETRNTTTVLTRGGDDAFFMSGTTNEMLVRMGAGDDSAQISQLDANSATNGPLTTNSGMIRMGHGSNNVALGGTHEGSIQVFGGNGDDVFQLFGNSNVQNQLLLNVGQGKNRMVIDGDVDSRLRVRADGGSNVLLIRPESIIGQLSMMTDAAQNLVSIRGTVTGNTFIHSRDFTNPNPNEIPQTVPRHETTTIVEGDVGGNLDVWIGDGNEHSLFVTGNVGGNLTAGGFDDDERTFVSTGQVTGNSAVTTSGFPDFLVCGSNEVLEWSLGQITCQPAG